MSQMGLDSRKTDALLVNSNCVDQPVYPLSKMSILVIHFQYSLIYTLDTLRVAIIYVA